MNARGMELTTAEMNASAVIDARIAAAYHTAVDAFNREHKPKLLCLRCLGVIGENCDCIAMVLPVMPMARANVIRFDDLFDADKRVKVGV